MVNRFGDFYGENDDREAGEPGGEAEAWRQEFFARLDDSTASVHELLEELALFEGRDPVVEASEREALAHAAGEIVRCLQPHFSSVRLALREKSGVVLTADQARVPSHYRSWLKQHIDLLLPQTCPENLRPCHIDAEDLEEICRRAFENAVPGRDVYCTVEATKNTYGVVAGFRVQLHFPSPQQANRDIELSCYKQEDGTLASLHTKPKDGGVS